MATVTSRFRILGAAMFTLGTIVASLSALAIPGQKSEVEISNTYDEYRSVSAALLPYKITIGVALVLALIGLLIVFLTPKRAVQMGSFGFATESGSNRAVPSRTSEDPSATSIVDPAGGRFENVQQGSIPENGSQPIDLRKLALKGRAFALGVSVSILPLLWTFPLVVLRYYDGEVVQAHAGFFTGDWLFRIALGLILFLVLTLTASLAGLLRSMKQRSLNATVVALSAVAIGCLCVQILVSVDRLEASEELAAFESWTLGTSALIAIIFLVAVPTLTIVSGVISKRSNLAPRIHVTPVTNHLQQSSPSAPPITPPDIVGRLTQLSCLRANGDLTEAEYSSAKERAISGE